MYTDSFCDFVAGSQVLPILHQAIKAYVSAENAKENGVKSNASLYLRRAEAYAITENYAAAISDYKTAALVLGNPNALGRGDLKSGDAEERALSVTKHVKHVAAFVAARGNLKESKISKQMKELPLPTQLVAGRVVTWYGGLIVSTGAVNTPNPNTGKALLVNIIADITRASLHAHDNSFFANASAGAEITPAYVHPIPIPSPSHLFHLFHPFPPPLLSLADVLLYCDVM